MLVLMPCFIFVLLYYYEDVILLRNVDVVSSTKLKLTLFHYPHIAVNTLKLELVVVCFGTPVMLLLDI